MTSLSKNVNWPWMALSCLAVWFLFLHAPFFWNERQLWTRDTMLAVHIIAAGTLYMACMHNCLFTPSVVVPRWLFQKSIKVTVTSKFMHQWVGRIGLVSGLLSFALGAYLAWTRVGMEGVGGLDLSFTLPITIGGILQVCSQYFGYTAIVRYKELGKVIKAKVQEMEHAKSTLPDEKGALDLYELKMQQRLELRRHVDHMTGLFASACGIPAGIRIAEFMTGQRGGLATWVAIAGAIYALTVIGDRYLVILMPAPPVKPMSVAMATKSSSSSSSPTVLKRLVE